MRVLVLAFRVEVTRARPTIPGAGRKHKAFTWSPTRSVNRIEGRVALPGATDEHFFRVGQGVRTLPSRRESKRSGVSCGPSDGRVWGNRTTSSVHGERSDQRWGGRARAERTKNISVNSVTLDVSKLSDWLNADANCRESKGGHAVRGEVCGRLAGDRGGKQRAGENSTADWGQGTERSARRTSGSWL